MTPPPQIVERLGLRAGEKALIRRRQMYAGGQPMQPATPPTSLVPGAENTQMAERDSGPGGISSRLADVGHGPVRFTFDASGAPVEVCEHVMSGDRWLLTYECPADWSAPPSAAIWLCAAWWSPRASFRADCDESRPSHELAAEFGLTEPTTAYLLFRARRALESALDTPA